MKSFSQRDSIYIKADAAAKAFGITRGWALGHAPFGPTFKYDQSYFGDTISSLTFFDHPYYFRAMNRPVAIVTHIYNYYEDCIIWHESIANKFNLKFEVDIAPRWWHPTATSILWTKR